MDGWRWWSVTNCLTPTYRHLCSFYWSLWQTHAFTLKPHCDLWWLNAFTKWGQTPCVHQYKWHAAIHLMLLWLNWQRCSTDFLSHVHVRVWCAFFVSITPQFLRFHILALSYSMTIIFISSSLVHGPFRLKCITVIFFFFFSASDIFNCLPASTWRRRPGPVCARQTHCTVNSWAGIMKTEN